MLTEQQVKTAMAAAGIEADLEAIGLRDKLSDHGIDSLDFFNLFLELEDLGGKRVPDELFEQMDCIEAIIKFYNE